MLLAPISRRAHYSRALSKVFAVSNCLASSQVSIIGLTQPFSYTASSSIGTEGIENHIDVLGHTIESKLCADITQYLECWLKLNGHNRIMFCRPVRDPE